MNADPAELEKFEKIAHRWWDPAGEFRPLHDINPLRLDWISKSTNLESARILDIGCGGGILAESMARRGARVTGIDLSEKARRVAEPGAMVAACARRGRPGGRALFPTISRSPKSSLFAVIGAEYVLGLLP